MGRLCRPGLSGVCEGPGDPWLSTYLPCLSHLTPYNCPLCSLHGLRSHCSLFGPQTRQVLPASVFPATSSLCLGGFSSNCSHDQLLLIYLFNTFLFSLYQLSGPVLGAGNSLGTRGACDPGRARPDSSPGECDCPV